MAAGTGKVIVQPTPAVAFGGREVAFFTLPNLPLIELIRAPQQQSDLLRAPS